MTPAPTASWIAIAPMLLEPPQTKTDLPVEAGFGTEVGSGRASASFLNRHVDAVEIANGRTAAAVYARLEGILATTSALQAV